MVLIKNIETIAMAKNRKTINTKNSREVKKRIISASFKLVSEKQWDEISISDIANAAKIPLIEVYQIFPSKNSILKTFNKQIDSQVLSANPEFSPSSTTRDQLFELIMLRFDLLSREKEAISRIIRGIITQDPIASFIGLENARISMKQTLEYVGISTSSIIGRLKVNGMMVIYLKTICTWLKDDSIGLEKTMADLDKYLTRGESLLFFLSFKNTENETSKSN